MPFATAWFVPPRFDGARRRKFPDSLERSRRKVDCDVKVAVATNREGIDGYRRRSISVGWTEQPRIGGVGARFGNPGSENSDGPSPRTQSRTSASASGVSAAQTVIEIMAIPSLRKRRRGGRGVAACCEKAEPGPPCPCSAHIEQEDPTGQSYSFVDDYSPVA